MQPRVLELRQYTLHPHQRDVLIELFDREFVESQEVDGMAILGQFRDLDNPDRFVWLRGFPDMDSRYRSLTSFYSGPTWRANAAQANATMIDSDDVLLLRPHVGFPTATAVRPPIGHTTPPTCLVLATLYFRDRPFDETFVEVFDRQVRPALAGCGVQPLAWLQTEHAPNTYPALPVREGLDAFVWFARFSSLAAMQDHLNRGTDAPLVAMGAATQHLRLAPTARSLLR